MVVNVGRLHSHGLVLCMSCGHAWFGTHTVHDACAVRAALGRAPGHGAAYHSPTAQHTPHNHEGHPPRLWYRIHAVAAHTTPTQIYDTAHPVPDTLFWDPTPILSHTMTTYLEIAHPWCRKKIIHNKIRLSNSKMKSMSKNLTKANGCALASVPSRYWWSWQASSTRWRAMRAYRTRSASTRAATTFRARQALHNAITESGTLYAWVPTLLLSFFLNLESLMGLMYCSRFIKYMQHVYLHPSLSKWVWVTLFYDPKVRRLEMVYSAYSASLGSSPEPFALT